MWTDRLRGFFRRNEPDRIAVQAEAKREALRRVHVPPDIQALAFHESEEWAREDTIDAAKEVYLDSTASNENAKWAEVRQVLGMAYVSTDEGPQPLR